MDNKLMQDFFQIISQFGFPIAVASYLLFRFEKKIDALELSSLEKIKKIDFLTEKVKDLIKSVNSLLKTK